MKLRTKIPNDKAFEIIKQLELKPGSSFTNPEPSELCSEFRIETGYWLSFGNNTLVKLIDLKDDNDKRYTTAELRLNQESLGIDEDEPTEEQNKRAKEVLNKIKEITGISLDEFKLT